MTRQVWIFLWEAPGDGAAQEERLVSCAKIYAEASGVRWAQRDGAAPGPKQIAIARHEKGKPYFPDWPGVHFSLSHSGGIAACAFHSQPVGLDLQAHTACRKEAVARRFFHPDEAAHLARNGYADFFQVWAAKESYVKYTGAGIASGLNAFCVVENGGLKESMICGSDVVALYRRELPEGYSLCLCAGSIPAVHVEDMRKPVR